MAASSFFSPPKTTSFWLSSVVKPRRNSWLPEERAPRLSQELPAQAMGPCTRWMASVTGMRTTRAPSKAQLRSVPSPGSDFLQNLGAPFSWWVSHSGAS